MLYGVGLDPYHLSIARRDLARNPDISVVELPLSVLTGGGAPPTNLSTSSVLLVAAEVVTELSPSAIAFPMIVCGPPDIADYLAPRVGDDFLATPWNDAELRYRVRRLFAARSLILDGGSLKWGRFWIESHSHDNQMVRIDMTDREYRLLDLLIRSDGVPVARELLETLSGTTGGTSRALDMQIGRARKKLSLATSEWTVRPRIVSCRGEGYAFVAR